MREIDTDDGEILPKMTLERVEQCCIIGVPMKSNEQSAARPHPEIVELISGQRNETRLTCAHEASKVKAIQPKGTGN